MLFFAWLSRGEKVTDEEEEVIDVVQLQNVKWDTVLSFRLKGDKRIRMKVEGRGMRA